MIDVSEVLNCNRGHGFVTIIDIARNWGQMLLIWLQLLSCRLQKPRCCHWDQGRELFFKTLDVRKGYFKREMFPREKLIFSCVLQKASSCLSTFSFYVLLDVVILVLFPTGCSLTILKRKVCVNLINFLSNVLLESWIYCNLVLLLWMVYRSRCYWDKSVCVSSVVLLCAE